MFASNSDCFKFSKYGLYSSKLIPVKASHLFWLVQKTRFEWYVFQSSPAQLKLAFQKVSILIFKLNSGNEQVQLGQGLNDAGRDPDHLQRVGPLVGPASSHLLHLRHLQVNISLYKLHFEVPIG
jgi:hypothetical protein